LEEEVPTSIAVAERSTLDSGTAVTGVTSVVASLGPDQGFVAVGGSFCTEEREARITEVYPK
jgi:hypothetical protein